MIGSEKTIELRVGVFVENHIINVFLSDSAGFQTEAHGVVREARITFYARKSFFLGGSDDNAIFDQAGSRVVIIGRDAQYANFSGHLSEPPENNKTAKKPPA